MRGAARWLAPVAAAAAVAVLAVRPPGAVSGPYGGGSGSLSASDTTVPPGGETTVSGDGFSPGANVTLTFESTPVALGTARADGGGRFTHRVRIPDQASAGLHLIRASGPAPGGAIRVLTVQVTVAAGGSSGPLGFTGAETMRIVATAALALVAGTLLVVGIRRRRPRPAAPDGSPPTFFS